MRTPLWIIHLQHWLTLTPAEFSFLAVMLGLLLLGMAGRLWIASQSPVDEDAYEELDAQFAELVAGLRADQERYPVPDHPSLDSSTASGTPASAGAGPPPPRYGGRSAGRVDINAASEAQLIGLPGIGPALARRIIQYRERIGTFGSVDQLREVSGIGDRKLAGLVDLVVASPAGGPADSSRARETQTPGARSP